MTATKILSMIESVSVDDVAMLDEIDARVWLWIGGVPFVKIYRCQETFKNRLVCMDTLADGSKKEQSFPIINHPTRSRNALKSIRPDGYIWTIDSRGIAQAWSPKANHPTFESRYNTKDMRGEHPKTEELAELHAIIQAIEWERENKV